ncbi:MAG: hypothetical protein HND55_07170 [Pseudomonadota bacterium]|nr:MAG: hypothetical protein HND55_07170 [Pseudomonadota bacterium]
MPLAFSFPVVIEAQPDTTTCGPTCLHAVYRHFGDDISLEQVIDEIHRLDHGGTLDVFLANHALYRGYRAAIHSWNLEVFDPTWFALGRRELAVKLRQQADFKQREKLSVATPGYLDFLASGGRIRFGDLNRALLRRLLSDGHPVLTGLSATYLYRGAREWGPADEDDDVRGEPVGHFVVLTGYRRETREVLIADPTSANPQGSQNYGVHIDRVIGAILLGALTYDANLLVIRPCNS